MPRALDPADISLEFGGAERLSLNAAGDLVVDGPAGRMCVEHPPVIYQQNGDPLTFIDGGYVVEQGNRVRFRLAAYDHRTQVIDPTL